MDSTGWRSAYQGVARAAALLVPLALVAATAGCRPAAEDAPALEVGFTDRQDLERAKDEATGLGLTRRDARGRVVSGLAQSWRVSNDGSFVIFRLRPMLAADGRAIEATNVARSLEAAVRASSHPNARDLLGGRIDARAPLPEVVEIRLPTPQPELPDLLALPELAIRPTGSGRRRTPRLPGPLMEAQAPPAEGPGKPRPVQTLLVPDPAFDLPAPDLVPAGVRLLRLDPEAAVGLFLEGRLDLVVGGLMRGLDDAVRIPERQGLVLMPARAVARLALNQSDGPLADVRVRRALALAIDRDGLAKAFGGASAARPLTGLMPPSLSGRSEAGGPPSLMAPLPRRQEAARQLLLEAGFGPGGERLRLRLAIGRSREETRLVEWLANDWAGLGVELVAERRSADGLAKAIETGAIELALELVESPVDAPTLFLARLPCGRNRLGICVGDADRLWQQSWSAPTLAARMEAVEAAHRLWLEDAAVIPLFQPVRWWLVSPRIGNWAPGVDSVHGLAHIRRTQR